MLQRCAVGKIVCEHATEVVARTYADTSIHLNVLMCMSCCVMPVAVAVRYFCHAVFQHAFALFPHMVGSSKLVAAEQHDRYTPCPAAIAKPLHSLGCYRPQCT
jgi:hypothetical protein